MASDQVIEKVKSLVAEVAEREGCILYEIEFQGRDLRVFIDKEGGAGIDDCSNVSRGLNLVLDEQDPIPGGAYNLEVSTPGLERVLKQPWHFEKVQGKKIWIKTAQSLEVFGIKNNKIKASKQLSEVLKATTPEGVEFELEDEKIFIPYSAIEKAKLVFEFAEKGKKKK